MQNQPNRRTLIICNVHHQNTEKNNSTDTFAIEQIPFDGFINNNCMHSRSQPASEMTDEPTHEVTEPKSID